MSVFLSYAFRPTSKAYERSEILETMERACATAQGDLRASYPSLRYDVEAELTEYGGHLNAELRSRLAEADICIVDISDHNPNVFYELGVVHQADKPAIVIRSSRAAEGLSVPSDIAGVLYLEYEEIGEIVGRLAGAILRATREVLSRAANGLELCRALWGPDPGPGGTIVLVPPRSSSNTQFAQPMSPNYIDVDRLGDKDAVFELAVLMARLYPDTPVVKYPSDDLPRDAYEQNMLVIGGPGGSKGASNRLVGPIHRRLGIPVTYDDACEEMRLGDGRTVPAEYADGALTRDYGFVARAANPFNPGRTVALFQGIHTFGVLAAARALSDHPAAQPNVELILSELGAAPSFWAWFGVDVVERVPIVPPIELPNVNSLASSSPVAKT